MFVWHLMRFVAVVIFLLYSAMQWEIVGNIILSVEGSMIKLSGPGSTIRFANTYTIVLILSLHLKEISQLFQPSDGAKLKVQKSKRKMNSVHYCHAGAIPAGSHPLPPRGGMEPGGWQQSQHVVGPGVQSALLSLPCGGTALLLQQSKELPALLMHISFVPSGPKDDAGKGGLRRHSTVTQLQI